MAYFTKWSLVLSFPWLVPRVYTLGQLQWGIRLPFRGKQSKQNGRRAVRGVAPNVIVMGLVCSVLLGRRRLRLPTLDSRRVVSGVKASDSRGTLSTYEASSHSRPAGISGREGRIDFRRRYRRLSVRTVRWCKCARGSRFHFLRVGDIHRDGRRSPSAGSVCYGFGSRRV